MPSVTPTARLVAQAAAVAFGTDKPAVRQFLDDDETHTVDLITCSDTPTRGFTTYSTVTLHETANLLDGANIPVELAGVAQDDGAVLANVLATAAFYVMKNQWLAAPGVVFPALLSEYGVRSPLEHVLWVTPFPWPQLGSVEIADELEVHWLLAIPISEPERTFLIGHGFDALEQRFADREVDYFDVSRDPVI